MNNENRTIESLLKNHDGLIYVRCSEYSVFKQFLNDAESEGFKIGDRRPTVENVPWDIMLVSEKGRLRYCGWTDHMAFQHSKIAVKIDYKKYIDNESNYYCDESVEYKLSLETVKNSK